MGGQGWVNRLTRGARRPRRSASRRAPHLAKNLVDPASSHMLVSKKEKRKTKEKMKRNAEHSATTTKFVLEKGATNHVEKRRELEKKTARCARPRASTRGEPRPGRGARTAARHRQVASKLNYPKPYALGGLERRVPPLHWLDKTAIGLDKTAIGIDIEASLDKMAIGAGLELKLASLCPGRTCLPREAHFCPGRLTRLSKIILDKHGRWPSHLWLRCPFVSSRNLKFARGPAVDKFFTREMVKIAIRAPNPEIWPNPKP